MRISRSATHSFGILALPTLTIVCVAYFCHYAISGPRGVLALERTQTSLDLQTEQLAAVQNHERALKHRISLIDRAMPDQDLVEELARSQLFAGAPHQVAVSREITK